VRASLLAASPDARQSLTLMAALRGDALLARGASLLAASPDARLWAIVVCGPAPSHGTLADVPALLAAGADPAALGWEEWDYVTIAAAAMRACADNGGYTRASLAISCAMNRYAALHGATLDHGDGALVASLARAASNVDVRGAYDNWTPLHAAIEARCVVSVRALLLAGAHPLARRDEGGPLPLEQALALPNTAASTAIAELLRKAIDGKPLPEPPPPLATTGGLSDSALREFSSAARASLKVHKSEPDIGVPAEAALGCGACGKHALRGDDPHGIRGQGKMRGLSKCGACECAFYCSRECQRADWARHKPVCLAARANPRPTMDLFINDLGREPSPEVIAAAVRVFLEKFSRGLGGKDNPCPSYVDANGSRKYC
jgi:hypothetical protein